MEAEGYHPEPHQIFFGSKYVKPKNTCHLVLVEVKPRLNPPSSTRFGLTGKERASNPPLASQFSSTLIKVPAPGTENDDHNPQRIQPRNLFDTSLGDDDLFHTEKYKWSARISVIQPEQQSCAL
jgi:hypothetical protein